jgi:dTDP-4-amino-4,6-dideoxygalactose transaminase
VINYGKQFIDTADINAVVKVLNSSWLTQGPEVKKFCVKK